MAKTTKPKAKPKKSRKGVGGAPTKYKPEYCESVVQYFSGKPYETDSDGRKTANDLPLMKLFAIQTGVCFDTLCEWRKVHQEFSESYKKARELQEAFWKTNSMHGLYNTAFTIFAGKNMFDWKDKHDIEHTGLDGLAERIRDSREKTDGKK